MATILALLLLCAGAALVLFGVAQRQDEDEVSDDPGEYLRSLDREVDETDEFQLLLQQPFLSRVVRPIAGGTLSLLEGVLPHNYRERIHTSLVLGGLAYQYRAEEIISLQALGGIVGFLLGAWIVGAGVVGGGSGLLILVLLPVLGVYAPKSWLDRKVQERKDSIRRDLPDTLDLLAISVEAGMGFEGALGVVCDNFSSPLADEFARTLREMELGLPRREALQNLKKRTEVPELSNFVLTLTQADALGMPVGRVLKTSAGEMRTKRQQWAREKAAKLPVKILFPLILFIFPAIFVVLLGPAASDIGGAFG
jgi:tight adherence protein C